MRLLAAALALSLSAAAGAAGRLTIATWNLEWMMTPAVFDALAPACFGRDARPGGGERAIPCDLIPAMRWSEADLARLASFAATVPADVIALHRKTGSVLVGTAMTSSPAKQPLSEVLDEVLEGRKKKWGSVRDVRRGKSKLGPLSAEWIGFSVPRGQGWVRSVTTLARKGPYALSLSCSDPPDAPACQDLVTSAVTVE